ncbi:MAG: WYL domain-containing protein [Actinomycetes bacterium]
MPASPNTAPLQRVLELMAYLDTRRGQGASRRDILDNAPGYDPDATDEASRKLLQRDIDDLGRSSGIDIAYNESDEVYRLQEPFFTPSERRAVVAAAALIDLEGFDPTGRETPAVADEDRMSVRVQIDALFTSLCDAIENRTPVTIRYDGRERVIEPWALGRWRTSWYLAAGDPEHDHALRRFRLDRFDLSGTDGALPVAGGPDAYAIPDGLDLEETFDLDPNSWGNDDPVAVEVRVAPDHRHAFLAEFDAHVMSEHDDHTVVGLTVRHRASFRIRILAFRGQAVVTAPEEIRAEIRDHLRRLAGGKS